MESAARRPALAEYLGGEQLRRLVKKKVFGGYEVPVGPFLTVGQWLFQSGAVLGRARRDQLEIFAKMFLGLEVVAQMYLQVGSAQQAREAAQNEQMVLTYLRETAKSLVLDYTKQHAKEPNAFDVTV